MGCSISKQSIMSTSKDLTVTKSSELSPFSARRKADPRIPPKLKISNVNS